MRFALLLMAVLQLLGTTAAASPIEPEAGSTASLASVGEMVGGAEVVELVDHPEFHRVLVRLPDSRTLTIELVATDVPLGACTHHGHALQPRWELLGVSGLGVEDQPPVVMRLCERLAASPPDLSLAMLRPQTAPDAAGDPREVQGFRLRPLHGVLGALVCAGLVGLLRFRPVLQTGRQHSARWEIGLVAALGLVLRLILGLWAPLWAPLFGFGRFASVMGSLDPVSLYGDGFASTMTLFTAVLGASSTSILVANLVLGALVPPLACALLRILMPDRPGAALCGGVLAAMLPVHVWLSTTEVMHVSLATFELLAVVAAVLFTRHDASERLGSAGLAIASGLATVMAVHTRPEAIPFVLVPALVVLLHASRGHRGAALLAGLLVTAGFGLRVAEMAFDIRDEASALRYDLLGSPRQWLALVWPDFSLHPTRSFISVAARPALTSPLLPVLAGIGLLRAPRRLGAWLAVWWLVSIVPVLPKGWPLADAYRLQLASLLPLVLLAGLGIGQALIWLEARHPGLHRWRWPALGCFALCLGPQLVLERPDWGTLDEARHMMEETPKVPPRTTVLYDDGNPHAVSIASWGRLAAPGTRWVGIGEAESMLETMEGLVAWVGTSCTEQAERDATAAVPAEACRRLKAACSLRPESTRTVPLTGDIDRTFLGRDSVVGFFRVEDCSASRSPGGQ